jgi:hypothetical protein
MHSENLGGPQIVETLRLKNWTVLTSCKGPQRCGPLAEPRDLQTITSTYEPRTPDAALALRSPARSLSTFGYFFQPFSCVSPSGST